MKNYEITDAIKAYQNLMQLKDKYDSSSQEKRIFVESNIERFNEYKKQIPRQFRDSEIQENIDTVSSQLETALKNSLSKIEYMSENAPRGDVNIG